MDRRRPLSLGRLYQAVAATVGRAVGAVLTLAQWEAGAGGWEAEFRDRPRQRPSQAADALWFVHQQSSPILLS